MSFTTRMVCTASAQLPFHMQRAAQDRRLTMVYAAAAGMPSVRKSQEHTSTEAAAVSALRREIGYGAKVSMCEF